MSDQEDNEIEFNDNKSTSSTTSMSRVAIECPCCKKELQYRHMFNHIRKIHPDYFSAMMRVYKEENLTNLIEYNFGLPLEWEYKNDFDETEFKNIWGCLACNSSFTVEHKANQHCTKDKCKAKHVSEIKKLIKEEKKEKEKKQKNASLSRSKWDNRTPLDIYNDCNNTLMVIENKIFKEYLPYFERLNSKIDSIPIPEFPLIINITYNDDKKYQVRQERQVDKYLSDVCNVVKSHNKNLPVQYVSDSKYEQLEKYTMLHQYIKYSADGNKCNAEWYGRDGNWGYTVGSI